MFKKALKRVGSLTVFDWSVLKICIVAFSLMLASLIPALVQVNRWIYGIVFVVGYVYIISKLYKK